MKSFDEWWRDYEESSDFVNSRHSCAQDAYEAGQQSNQAEIDELQKHKEILLSELYLMGDAIQYNRVLNLLKGNQND